MRLPMLMPSEPQKGRALYSSIYQRSSEEVDGLVEKRGELERDVAVVVIEGRTFVIWICLATARTVFPSVNERVSAFCTCARDGLLSASWAVNPAFL